MHVFDVYKEAVAKLDTSHFGFECRSFFLHSFKKKDDPMGAGALWRDYQESRTKMRCSIIPLLPTNFCNMKSGKGFHDTFDEVFRSQFRRELHRKQSSMTVAEIDVAAFLLGVQKEPVVLWTHCQDFLSSPPIGPRCAC